MNLPGKYRKNHIPHTSGFGENSFQTRQPGVSWLQTRYAKVGVYCYDRHFPDGHGTGLNGARDRVHLATVAGPSQYL